ncbi:Serine/threonine-protein phosphatase pgam5, mitochondrial [Perkinsus olseni]|uniref:Serine/threonine-protein phosphatase PGAM5, mitochondrial n=1 Tax=Perkinsus olseni TaxID=32597 RepID=A0A7J6LB53_PEROL|nr:Serine/threonine-protein phosphatase pgam5, mitochondrial [Perkinsus olseni]
MFVNPRLRFVGRRFAVVASAQPSTKAKAGSKMQFKHLAVLLGFTGISVAVGNVVYDYIVWSNLEQIDSAVKAGLYWDPEWDSYELLDDSDMLVQPAIDESLRAKRKQWEHERGITRRLILMVRHGSVQSVSDKTQLSDAGRKEMELTAERIASIVTEAGGEIRAIAHSSSDEAASSAEIIAARLKVELEPTPLLDEGFPEMPDPAVSTLTPDMIVPEETARLESGFRTYFDKPSSSANTPPPAREKKSKRSRETPTDDDNDERVGVDILVGHGNQTRYFLCRALQLSSAYWLRFTLSPASITAIDITREGRVKALMVGDCGHIRPSKASGQ